MKRRGLVGLPMLLIALVLALTSAMPASAHGPNNRHDPPPLGPTTLPVVPSNPQQEVDLPDPQSSKGTQAVTNPRIDLKVLVISATGNKDIEPAIEAVTQALQYQGTPYTHIVASQLTNGLQASSLFTGAESYYQGVVLTSGSLAYAKPDGTWASALSPDDWQTLWAWEASFGIRQVSMYTFPTPDFGYGPASGVSTDVTPVIAKMTPEGAKVFNYMNPNTELKISKAWTYLAQTVTTDTVPLLTDASGNALASVRTFPDGRQNLALTFDNNYFLIHSLAISPGVINWVTGGLFLGDRHVFMHAQIDDLLIDADVYRPGVTQEQCPALGLLPAEADAPDPFKCTYRSTGNDFNKLVDWQKAHQKDSVTRYIELGFAFNGIGAVSNEYDDKTLVDAIKKNGKEFTFINHTYEHLNLDGQSYATVAYQILANDLMAKQLKLKNYNRRNFVSPDISGLTNLNFYTAAWDTGIRYIVSDTSYAAWQNPSPNVGIVTYQTATGQILALPRLPTNLFYNVTTPDEWVNEYHAIYNGVYIPGMGKTGDQATYQDILNFESDLLVSYLLKSNLDPWMFHETNIRAYDGTHSLIGDLLDMAFQKYSSYFMMPILSTDMDQIGSRFAARDVYNKSGVTAYIQGGKIFITVAQDAVIPVTGLNSKGAEQYAGQYISYVTLKKGQTINMPLTSTGAASNKGKRGEDGVFGALDEALAADVYVASATFKPEDVLYLYDTFIPQMAQGW